MLLYQLCSAYKKADSQCENTEDDSHIDAQCREIEQAVGYLKEKQQCVLTEWKNTGEQNRMRLLLPVIDGVDEMLSFARNSGCEAVGEYLENEIMGELLDMLDLPE